MFELTKENERGNFLFFLFTCMSFDSGWKKVFQSRTFLLSFSLFCLRQRGTFQHWAGDVSTFIDDVLSPNSTSDLLLTI